METKANALTVVCEEDISLTKELRSVVENAPWLNKDIVRRDSEASIEAMDSEIAAASLDLKTDAGRKKRDKIRAKYQAIFKAYEENIKTFKKATSEPAAAVDAVSKIARSISEEAFAKTPRLTGEYGLLKKQEDIVYRKWQKLEGIPQDRYGLETLLSATRNAGHLEISSDKELSDFREFQGKYTAAIEAALNRLALEEKARREEAEAQAKEAAAPAVSADAKELLENAAIEEATGVIMAAPMARQITLEDAKSLARYFVISISNGDISSLALNYGIGRME